MCEAQGEQPWIGWGHPWQVASTREDAQEAGELGLLKGNFTFFLPLPEGCGPPSTILLNSLPKAKLRERERERQRRA